MNSHPYVSLSPPISGQIKQNCEDFIVEEIPAYLPSGKGEHLYLWIEKRGMTTDQAIGRLAKYLKISRMNFGSAGLKDARAVTRQWISIHNAEAQGLERFDCPGLSILEINRHANKLRMGHLRGNRFQIKIRNFDARRFSELETLFVELSQKGVPNYFGEQRFGIRGDNWKVGKAIIQEDWHAAVEILAGSPLDSDTPEINEARRFFRAQQYEKALGAWPNHYDHERKITLAMIHTQGNPKKSLLSLGQPLTWFFITALQSHLFNQVLARRISAIDQVQTGDLAYRHDNGSVFLVEDIEAENKRAASFEISPSGPLYGYKMTEPEAGVWEIEEAILTASGLKKEDFKMAGAMNCKGARRPLRFPVKNATVLKGQDEGGEFVLSSFELPAGCYATSVFREVFKTQAADPILDNSQVL